MLWLLVFPVVVILYLVYKNVIKPLNYWKNKGVPYVKPLPIFGNYLPFILRTKHIADIQTEIYNDYPHQRYVGMYQFNKPTLMIRDLELIKKMSIKDFDHFVDHIGFIDNDPDPIMSQNLFMMKGNKWKDMRATLSPIFTSAKIKNMAIFMKECAENLNKSIPVGQGVVEFNIRDLFYRFTNDVIASTAFGVKCNTIGEGETEFFKMARKFTALTGLQGIKIFLQNLIPVITKYFKISMFPQKELHYFKDILVESMKQREEKNIVRPDLIHLLIQAKNGKLVHENLVKDEDAGFATVQESELGKANVNKTEWSDDEITAQGLLFFFAGFEGMSSTAAFVAYELAVNPEAQKKLQEEIDDVFHRTGGSLQYDHIVKMKYLDQVVAETLRVWSVGFQMDRVCVKDYTIPAELPDEKDLIVEAGTVILMPVMGIHHNPEYYENPEKFDPDRFSEENKHQIKPDTYMPFGIGPRNCIGSRFALIELKIIFCYLLREFDIVPTAKTEIPYKLNPKNFNFTPEPMFLGLKPRDFTIKI